MSRFLLGWEIGGGYWHLAQLLALADELKRRGHEPVLAVRNLVDAGVVLADRGYPIVQAPVWIGSSIPAVTYPGLLAGCGYGRASDIRGLLKGWVQLLELVRPDFLIAEYAPTAVLAARAKSLPAAAIGTSYFCPPRTTPLPVLPGHALDREAHLDLEARVLRNVNDALASCGSPPLATLADMFPAVGDILTTLPELDHYGPRHDQTYCGPLGASFGGARPAWPAGDGPRIIAYVETRWPGFAKLVADLRRLGMPTLVHARGSLPPEAPQPATTLAFSAPMDLDYCLDGADLVVCHASHGMAMRSLLRAVPLVLLPLHREHAATRDRVIILGAGLSIPDRSDAATFDYAALVSEALASPALARAATDFAQRYALLQPAIVPGRIIDLYEGMLAPQR